MFLDPVSLLSVHYAERRHEQPRAPRVRRSIWRSVPRPVRSVAVSALRAAYVRARAAQLASSLSA